MDEIEDDDDEDLLDDIELEQAPPVVPVAAPEEPPVKRKRGRPPKNKPNGERNNALDLISHSDVTRASGRQRLQWHHESTK